MISIGVRAHDFGVGTADELACRIQPSGARSIQLALSKALLNPILAPLELGPEGRAKLRTAFQNRDIEIAILGCYINPIHPDGTALRKALERFEDHLRWACDFHCSIVGTETGSKNPDCSFHPLTASEDSYRELLASVKRLSSYAESMGKVFVGIEPVAETHTISSPEAMGRLLDDVNSPALGVIFDPTNLTPKNGVQDQGAFLDSCFSAFGSRILALHAKDYRIITGPKGPEKSPSLPAGKGENDWIGIFRRLQSLGKVDIPILLEDLRPEEVPQAISTLQAAWKQAQEITQS